MSTDELETQRIKALVENSGVFEKYRPNKTFKALRFVGVVVGILLIVDITVRVAHFT